MKGNKVEECHLVQFNRYFSPRRGTLTDLDNGITLPFETKRIYYLYDVPSGESRGSHAHKSLEQIIIAASGAFRVTLDDGCNKKSFVLNRPNIGLYVKPGMWRDLEDFTAGAICLVLASETYDENDYIRDYSDFLKFKGVE